MKKLLIPLIMAVFAFPAFASRDGLYTSNQGSTYTVLCASSTMGATALFSNSTDADIESVTYYASSVADIYISTYSAPSTAGCFIIKAGAIPMTIGSTAFRFAQSSNTANAPINILICK